MKDFKDLGLGPDLLKSVQDEGFDKPTQIQAKSIPPILEGKDVIAGSATGSGKTFAFSSGIVKTLERGKGVQALVLAPTRELAEQVSEELEKFSKYKKLTITSVYGGVSITPQIEKLHKTDVVVGTPGRVLDHLSRRTLDLSKVKVLVLDEADRMLDMGFIEDVERIMAKCPKKRQTLLFSATIVGILKRLVEKHMVDPIKISIESYVDPKKLDQIYYNVRPNEKFSLLVHLLKQERQGLVMVFCNTQRNTDFVAKNLKKQGINATAIHGGITQAKRNITMDKFAAGHAHVLVCTDVAARGLHVENVSHVYNYDIPNEAKQYVHRIGRTARAGKEGMAINILAEPDYDNFDRVLRDNDVDVRKEQPPKFPRIQVRKNKDPRGPRNFQKRRRPR